MKIHKAKKRKDGKFLVSIGFTNGVHLRKIWSLEKLTEEIARLKREADEQGPETVPNHNPFYR